MLKFMSSQVSLCIQIYIHIYIKSKPLSQFLLITIQYVATISDCRDEKEDDCSSKLIPEVGCDDADVSNLCENSCGLCGRDNGDKGREPQ